MSYGGEGVARMRVLQVVVLIVFGVIAASIFSGSILHVSGSISTNTGLIPFHHSECVVATKL